MITSQSPLPGWRIAPGNVAKLWPPGRRLGIDAGFYTFLYRSYDVLYLFYTGFILVLCQKKMLLFSTCFMMFYVFFNDT